MEKCFYIDGRYLYLEQVLVEYNGIPIYFLCKDGGQYYTALCTDIDEWKYIVVRTAVGDVYGLLHGRIPMRDVILRADYYWQVVSAEDMLLDDVKQMRMDEVDRSLLPEAGACFEILTEDVRAFVEKFDSAFWNSATFSRKPEEMPRAFELTSGLCCKDIEAFEYIANYMLKLRAAEDMSSLPAEGNFELREEKKTGWKNNHEDERWIVDDTTQIAA